MSMMVPTGMNNKFPPTSDLNLKQKTGEVSEGSYIKKNVSANTFNLEGIRNTLDNSFFNFFERVLMSKGIREENIRDNLRISAETVGRNGISIRAFFKGEILPMDDTNGSITNETNRILSNLDLPRKFNIAINSERNNIEITFRE